MDCRLFSKETSQSKMCVILFRPLELLQLYATLQQQFTLAYKFDTSGYFDMASWLIFETRSVIVYCFDVARVHTSSSPDCAADDVGKQKYTTLAGAGVGVALRDADLRLPD